MSDKPVKTKGPSPDIHFAFRSLKSLELVKALPTPATPQADFQVYSGEARALKYDREGNNLAYATATNVVVVDAATHQTKITIPHPDVLDLSLSPRGNFVITWQRTSKNEDGSAKENLFVYEVSTGKAVARFIQKGYGQWEPQWTWDEGFMARMVTNEVHVYDKQKLVSGAKSTSFKLHIDGLGDFSLSPGRSSYIAAFLPEKKGAPAAVRLYSVPNFKSPIATKSFYKADKVQMTWNELGTALLVLTQTEVDKTGKSYYGESNLYYLAVAGNFDCRVPLDKEGPIHDVVWSPSSKEFAVSYGFMPAKTTIFDHRANVVHSFGELPRNYIRFSPHGRYLLLGGFGNLNGMLDVWDRQSLTKVCTVDGSGSAYCEWMPDGRHILTATLSPRLRVDNGFKLWHSSGVMIHEESHNELYQVAIRPRPVTLFPFRTQGAASPPPKPCASAASRPVASKPAGAYRPPHARNAPEKVGLPSGASTDSKAKNSTKNTKSKLPPGAAPVEVVAKPAVDPEIAQKRVRALQKKLKQINALVEKVANGEKLDADQVSKINQKADVLQELESLSIGSKA
ncbi:hypothetical protein DSO57_1002689 [Entomophthora muscae]|uniref:Uncharacterized protein n=1 Tax=Entomophthora muscae TaxID=34485 RepID=A0ACC2UII0_9FUNG|nr:hypothetical protein DSO57_1002689 [Entomophthora muscae]